MPTNSSKVPCVLFGGCMDDKTREKCLQVLAKISRHNHAKPFLSPVDPIKDGAPTYLEVITRPMDLGTIRVFIFYFYFYFSQNNLKNKKYLDTDEFASDVRLVWDNAIKFNPDGTAYNSYARELAGLFEDSWKKVIEELQKASSNENANNTNNNNNNNNNNIKSSKNNTLELKRKRENSLSYAFKINIL